MVNPNPTWACSSSAYCEYIYIHKYAYIYPTFGCLWQVRSVLRDAERLLLRSLAGGCEQLSLNIIKYTYTYIYVLIYVPPLTILQVRSVLRDAERPYIYLLIYQFIILSIYTHIHKCTYIKYIYRHTPPSMAGAVCTP